MSIEMEPSWKSVLQDEFEKPYFGALSKAVDEARQTKIIYPPAKNIFQAFTLCPFNLVKVVILGQDPYHGPGQAHGLCFSVPAGVKIPPSLQNIYKEIKADIGTDIPPSGNLERWATQGVLLLNTTLTVIENQPGSHHSLGWETFTDTVIKTISEQKEHVVFLLWGNLARTKAALIDQSKHFILEAPHPSPLSAHRGFFGSRHFSQTNMYLQEHGNSEIIW